MFEKTSYGDFAKKLGKETHITLKAAKALVVTAEPKAKDHLGQKITSLRKFKPFVARVLGAAHAGGRRLYQKGRSTDKVRRDLINEAMTPNSKTPEDKNQARRAERKAFLKKIKSGSVLNQIEKAEAEKKSLISRTTPISAPETPKAAAVAPKPQHIEMAPGLETPPAAAEPETRIYDMNIG